MHGSEFYESNCMTHDEHHFTINLPRLKKLKAKEHQQNCCSEEVHDGGYYGCNPLGS